jgi:hypothetical protein
MPHPLWIWGSCYQSSTHVPCMLWCTYCCTHQWNGVDDCLPVPIIAGLSLITSYCPHFPHIICQFPFEISNYKPLYLYLCVRSRSSPRQLPTMRTRHVDGYCCDLQRVISILHNQCVLETLIAPLCVVMDVPPICKGVIEVQTSRDICPPTPVMQWQ